MVQEPSGLIFEEGSHTYWHDGVIVPSVTQILDSAGLYDFGGASREDLERARRLGTEVHQACHFDDEGDLEEGSYEAIKGYVEAWRSFRGQKIDKLHAVESRVFHPKLRYAGTFDVLATLKGAAGHLYLLDRKTGVPQRAAGPQTAAYAHALGEPRIKRASVHLRADGTWQLLPHRDATDWSIFNAALVLHRWRKA